MVEYINNWIYSIAAIALLTVLIEIILPEGNLRKYIRLVLGILVFASIIKPFANIFDKSFNFDSFWQETFMSVDENVLKGTTEKISLNDSLDNSILKLYKDKVKKHINEEIVKNMEYEPETDVEICEDAKSKEFGKILGVNIVLKAKNTNKLNTLENIRIKDVEVSISNNNNNNTGSNNVEKNNNENKEYLGNSFDAIKNKISADLGINIANISINIENK